MKQILRQLWLEDDGVLSFEWTILAVVIVFGIVGGLAAARDTLIDELGDLSAAVVSFDQSFSFTGIPTLGVLGSSYVDIPGVVDDCGRQTTAWGIMPRDDRIGGG